MNFRQYMKGLRFQVRLDKCGDPHCRGRLGNLFQYSDTHIGAMFIPPWPSRGWKTRRERLVAAAARVVQNGDTEGTVIFPFAAKECLLLAARLLGIRRRRNISPEHLAELRHRLQSFHSPCRSVLGNSGAS